MRIAAAVLPLFICGSVGAQSPKPEVDWTAISAKVAAINAAVAARDIKQANEAVNAAWLLTAAEWHKQAPTPADYLQKAEDALAANPASRGNVSSYLAKMACQAGQMDKAESYAREALRNPPPIAPSLAESIHTANNVLGFVALQRGDVAGARTYLLASTKVSGSSILDRWGPNLALAKVLLEKGQNDLVAEYFHLCKTFVTKNPKLDDWIAMLKGGRAPDLSHEYLWH